MHIETFTTAHIEDAAKLVLKSYMAEQSAVDCLPLHDDYVELFMNQLAGLAGGANGIEGFTMTEGGKLLGFLSGYPVEQFFSSHRGVYVPALGHGAIGGDRNLVYQKLYEAASASWVRDQRLTHCVSMFAHDAETVDTWYWLGFGLRCVDAIRPLSDVDTGRAAPLQIRKAGPDDAELLFPLHREHGGYYRSAPLFMPTVAIEDSVEDFKQWLGEAGNHLWVAFADGIPISYMRLRHGGETFVSDDLQMVNICGAYTMESARRTGAGALLLSAIVEWARAQGCVRLGVDYESFNINGSRFWRKHFTPFLYSAVRRIDDRILSS